MKLLRVISSMNPKSGGPAQGIRNLNTHLATLGVDVTVVCLDDEDVDYGVEDDFKIVKLGKGKTAFKFNTNLKRWLIENLSNFDVALVHGLWQYHNYAVYKAIKKLKQANKLIPKVAIMPHGMLDPYFQNAPERRVKAIRNRLIWRLNERNAINAADALFFTCQSELELARTTFTGYKPKSEINVGYGIKHPPKFNDNFKTSFLEQCNGLNGNDYLLFLSRIDSKKGVDILIETYQALISEGITLPDLVIAGPINNAYAKAMIQKAKSTATIHFPGMLVGNAKWGAFYGASAFVLPSYQENFGIAIVEAMACSVPVLITKKVNIWQEIVEAKAGWAINSPDVQDLKEQLKQFFTLTFEEKEQLKSNAKVAFEKLYQVEKTTKVFAEQLKNT
tara:strand:- start:624 stop:1796 length:1173 start_codon:yes stop_codon:yes gene_type:complete